MKRLLPFLAAMVPTATLRLLVVATIATTLLGPSVPTAAAQTANTPPAASNGSAVTHHGHAVVIGVLGLATDPDPGDALSLVGWSQGGGGAAADSGDGSLTYTPVPGFVGQDSFTYTVADLAGLTATGVVTVEVTNGSPVASPGSAMTHHGSPVVINLLTLAADPDGDLLTVTTVSPGAFGATANNGDGTVIYTPSPGYVGIDSFDYTIGDGAAFASATVTIEVTNAGPAAATDLVTTEVDTPVTIDLLTRTSDPDGEALAVVSIAGGDHGTVIDNSDGTVTYNPATGFVGQDAFTYTVSDGATEATGTIAIDVVAPAPAVPPALLTVTVYGEDTGEAPLIETCAALYTYEGSGGFGEWLADACDEEDGEWDGVIHFPTPPPAGDYQLITPGPDGYETADTFFRHEEGVPTALTVILVRSAAPAGLTIAKLGADTGSSPLAGACFQIYLDDGDRIFAPADRPSGEREGGSFGIIIENPAPAGDYLEGDTCDAWDDDSDGLTHFFDLIPGDYWIVESMAPDGYALAPRRLVTVAAGQTTREEIVDEPGGLTVSVFGYDTGATPLEWVCVEAWHADGHGLATRPCNGSGNGDRIHLPLSPGRYRLVVYAPVGYARRTFLDVEVAAGSPNHITVTVPKGASLTVHHRAADTGAPITNGCFDLLYDGNGDGQYTPAADASDPTGDLSWTWECDIFFGQPETERDGNIPFISWGGDLAPGTYLLRQHTDRVPWGYIPAPLQTVTIIAAQHNTTTVYNQPGGAIVSVFGEDAPTTPFPGTVFFGIYADDGNGQPGEFVDSSWTGRDRVGQMFLPLPPGNYVLFLHEFWTPPGYLPLSPVPFVVVAGASTRFDVVIPRPLGTIAVTKLGSDTGTTPQPGACFDLYRDVNADGIHQAGTEPRHTSRCDAADGRDGTTTVPLLPGGAYLLVETRAPFGYLIDPTPVAASVAEDETTVVEFVDHPGGLVVTTYGEDTGTSGVAAACYSIYRDAGGGALGNSVMAACDPQDDGQIGQIGFGLAPGAYVLVPFGSVWPYALAPQMTFSVTAGAATAVTVVLKLPVTGPIVTARGSDTGNGTLPGLCWELWKPNEFQLFPVASACDDADGVNDGVTRLPVVPARDYHLHLHTTPAGYLPFADLRFAVSADETARLDVVIARPASLTITKLGSDTGDEIHSGACFDLHRDDGNGVFDAATDQQAMWSCDGDLLDPLHISGDGLTSFTNILPGSYFLVETRAPSGYFLAAPIPLSIVAGEVKQIEVVDDPKYGDLVVRKLGSTTGDEPIPGACFDIYRDEDRDGLFDNAAGDDPEAFWIKVILGAPFNDWLPIYGYNLGADTWVGFACDDGLVGFFGGDGQTTFQHLRVGDYFLAESQPPRGYQLAAPQLVTIAAAATTTTAVVVGSSRVDLQACKLEYSIVSPK